MALLLANRYTARVGSTSHPHQRLPSSERSKLSTLQEGFRTGLRPMPKRAPARNVVELGPGITPHQTGGPGGTAAALLCLYKNVTEGAVMLTT